MSPLATQRIAQTPRWAKNELWRRARAVPSLDLRFADNKSLVDATTGQNLVTFSRASGATYVDSQGVIRNAVTNLLLRSEEFDNASWSKVSTTVTANAAIAPNGTLTADKIIETTANDQHIVYQAISGTGRILSFYAKAAERSWVTIWGASSGISRVNLTNGTTGTLAPGAVVTTQPVGNGWYRISVTETNASFQVIGVAQSDATISYTGDGTSGIYLWGAQLEQSSTVGEYVPTGATINSAPRFDHNPTTGESLGLLVEESRTNLLLRSEDFGVSPWNRVRSSITTSTEPSPIGIASAQVLVENTDTNSHYLLQDFTQSGSAAYVASVYLKSAGRRFARLTGSTTGNAGSQFVNFDLQAGSVNSASGATGSISPVGNGWYRCTCAFTSNADASYRVSIWLLSDSVGATYTGDGTSGIFIWGAQLEAGAFPTSYIKTEASTVTRAADVASISGSNFSSWYRQDEGTVYADTASIYNGGRYFMFDNGTTNERWEGRYTSFLANANSWSNNVLDVSINTSVTGGTPSTNVRLAIANASNNAAIASNGAGATVGTDSSSTMPANQSRLFIGSFQGTATFANGPIRRLTYWPQRLGNEVLQRLTQ